MLIYGIILFIFIVLWIQTQNAIDYDEEQVLHRKYSYLISSIFIIVAALRGITVGADTASYVRDYSYVQSYSFDQIVELYPDNSGYYVVSKIFADFGVSVQIWFAIVAGIYIYSVARLIYRFSSDPVLSYILFLTIGFYGFSLAGLKQTVAMAFVFISYRYLYDNKYIRFSFFVLLASWFHLSSLVFLLAVVIHFLKKLRFYYVILSVLFIIWMVAYNTIVNRVLTLLDFDHYMSYLDMERESNGTLTMFFIVLLIQLVCIIYMNVYTEENSTEAREIFGMSYLGLLAQVLSLVVASAFRIGLYFSLFSVILLPNCISKEKNPKIGLVLKIGIICIFCFYFWYSNHNGSSIAPYIFYWTKLRGL